MDDKSKKLILSADDFGLHESINESIEMAYREGVLTSASLAATGESFDHAVYIAKQNPRLGAGIHLVLTDERPVSAKKKITSIVNGDGRLLNGYIELCSRILKGRVDLKHIAIECEAQILKFLKAGLVPTHVDSHQHLHLFPPIFKIVEPLLRKYGIRRIRSLNVPYFDYRGKKSFLKVGFTFFARNINTAKRRGYRLPDYFVGFFRSGRMDLRYLEGILSEIKPGVTEIVFHPGTDNRLIMKRYGFWKERYSWGCDWEKELNLLLNPSFRMAIDSNLIRPINYSDI